MSEELVTSLQSYKVQLSQVEQSLLTDPPNVEELLKLKKDLEEVISLTQSLIEPIEERAPRSVAQYLDPSASKSTQRPWKVGDRCEAFMSKENRYQVGTIKEILEDRTCSVAFGIKYSEIVQLDSLRITKIKLDPQREHRRQKAKKYEEKVKEEMKIGEDIKGKWQAFSTKMTKTKKVIKKSIFATPDTFSGRVGVGTCGIGGRPMTKFSQGEKLNRGSQ